MADKKGVRDAPRVGLPFERPIVELANAPFGVIAEIKESADGDGGKKEDKQDTASEAKKDKKESEKKQEDKAAAKTSAESGDEGKADEAAAPGKQASGDIALKGYSPAVRRIAAEEGLDPANVEGSGKGGRVTKGDMLAALEERESGQGEPSPAKKDEPAEQQAPAPAPASGKQPAAGKDPARTTRKKMSPLRRRIAERLVQASQEAALLTTFNEVDMSAVMALRKKHQEAFTGKHEIKLGFMSFFVKATVQALKAVPGVNAQIDGEELIQNHYYDIGMAVGTDRGLIVPVLRDCDTESFAGIEKQINAYAKKAREGKIEIADLEGGVFTISNGGIYGSMLSTPIINPPQSGILGLHNIQQRPTVVDGEVVARPMMYLALTYDHRLVDGKEAVTFLKTIKECIEDPARMLFEV